MKDFDSWNEFKKKLESNPTGPFFKEREVWFTAVGLNVGFEEDGKNNLFERPVMVLKRFNRHLFIGVPFSSILKPANLHYQTVNLADGKHSSVILSQTRPFSAKRLLRRMFILDEKQFLAIQLGVANQIITSNKTDSALAKSSGPEGIYVPSIDHTPNLVNAGAVYG